MLGNLQGVYPSQLRLYEGLEDTNMASLNLRALTVHNSVLSLLTSE